MKKFLTLSAVAVAVTMTAAAMEPKANNSIQDAMVSNASLAPQSLTTMSITRADGPKKVTSVDDLCGNYSAKYYYWLLEGNDQFGGVCNPVITKGASENEILITGLPYVAVELKATVDLTAGTVTVPEQNVMYMASEGEYMKFVGITGSLDGEQVKFGEGGPFVINITENGLQAPYNGFCYRITRGYYFAAAGFDVQNIKQYLFGYNADEWVEEGTAKFTDNAFRDIYQDPTAVPSNVEVPLYMNKKDNNILLLMNPYKCGEWPYFNPIPQADANKNGFIQFSIEDPFCIPMRPYVGSGFYFDMGSQTASDIQETYLYNSEGMKYFNGAYLEDIAAELAAAEKDCSYYDEKTRTVYIYNGLFGVSSDPGAAYCWRDPNDEKKSIYLEWEIVLPDLSAVNGIEADSNVAPKYYNLQGMEVKAPVAGELVIVKQGGKSYKTIAK